MRPQRRLGIAGWLVLSVGGFLLAEPTGPATLAETPEARAASDWAVRLAGNQIASTMATSSINDSYWVSQPGALRQILSDGKSGFLVKLYSSPKMWEGSVDAALAEGSPVLATTDPLFHAIYCDLNEPTVDGQGRLHFPIVDPRAYRANRGASVEGFSYSDGPPGTVTPEQSENADDQRLPMHVTWLYLLADGTTAGTMDASGKFTALVGAPRGFAAGTPTVDNPIVSRVAFWTDDASCRINVNTASEGVFWDTPRCDTVEERAYGKYQPAANEHVRAMAHPAAVCLSSVLFPRQRLHLPQADSSDLAALSLEKARAIWASTPFLQGAGSEGGTVAPPDFAPESEPPTARLHASVPEYLSAVSQRTETDIAPEVTEFFLTARSRAPEVTFRNLPRVSLWPVPADALKRTAFDQAALEATQPGNAQDGRGALSYLRTAWNEPDKEFEAYDADGVMSANYRLYRYLTAMAYLPSGSGSASGYSLDRKYGKGYWKIITQNLDYIRCSNPTDPGLPADARYAWHRGPSQPGFGEILPLAHATFGTLWTSWPINRGFGRFPTITGVGLWIGRRTEIANGILHGSAPVEKLLPEPYDPSLHYTEFEADLVAQGFCAAHGWPPILPEIDVSLVPTEYQAPPGTTIPNFTLAGQPGRFPRLLPPNNPGVKVSSSTQLRQGFNAWGGTLNPDVMLSEPIPLMTWGRGSTGNLPPSVGDDMISFSGTNALVTQAIGLAISEAGNPSPFQAIQTGWPSFTFSAPEKVLGSLSERFRRAQVTGVSPFDSDDILQSIVVSHGDARLTAPVSIVGTDYLVGDDGTNYDSYNIGFVAARRYGSGRIAMRTGNEAPAEDRFRFTSSGEGYGYLGSSVEYDPGHVPDYAYLPDDTATVEVFSYRRAFPPLAINAGAFDLGRYFAPRLANSTGPFRPDLTGDFDNGVGPAPDGPYINMADGGDVRAYTLSGGTPYFDDLDKAWQENPTTFSPYRHVPSAVMLGSLPTGVEVQKPWQTALFRPEPRLADGTKVGHYGATSPPDHHMLDFYRMPIVTPWEMSDYVSTEGRINMNYQIVPFGHIHRSTAMHALLKAQKFLAIPDAAAARYKSQINPDRWRHYIDAPATLSQWDGLFSAGKVYRFPSEICEQWMVPEGLPPSDQDLNGRMSAFWAQHRLTGDNSRERVYANLYPHLTTRSNTFIVYVVAESIQKSKDSSPDRFDPSLDTVSGRVRRTVHLEKWLDVDDPAQRDFPALSATGAIGTVSSVQLSFDLRRVADGQSSSDPASPTLRTYDARTPDDPADDRYYFECQGVWEDVLEVQSSTDLVHWSHFRSQSVGVRSENPTLLSMEVTSAVKNRTGPLFFRARSAVPAP